MKRASRVGNGGIDSSSSSSSPLYSTCTSSEVKGDKDCCQRGIGGAAGTKPTSGVGDGTVHAGSIHGEAFSTTRSLETEDEGR